MAYLLERENRSCIYCGIHASEAKPSFNKKISFFFNQDGMIKSFWFGSERLPNFDLDKDLPHLLKRLCEAYSQFKQVEKPEGVLILPMFFTVAFDLTKWDLK